MHGHPYPSVFAFDTVTADPSKIVDTKLDPNSPLKGRGSAPSVMNMTAPTCTTLAPEAPRSIENKSDAPLHYDSIELKHVDGEEPGAHWQDWYPWMKYMKNIR